MKTNVLLDVNKFAFPNGEEMFAFLMKLDS